MKVFILFLILFFIYNNSVFGEDLLFFQEDDRGDDYGPGTYVYPLHPHFHPHQGLFDLQEFRVREGEDAYFFDFTFGELTNPWEGFFGFSHPIVHIYIDNEEGGSTEPVKPVLEIKMSPEFPWNKAIIFSGWWIQGLKEGEEWRSPEDDISWESPRPTNLEGSDISVERNTITLEIPSDWVGQLDEARYYIIVGAYDPLDPYYFRGITEEPTLWSFGGKPEGGPGHPIIDLLLPENLEQQELLAQKNPVLKPIGPIPPEKPNYPALVMIAVYLFGIFGSAVFLVQRKKAS